MLAMPTQACLALAFLKCRSFSRKKIGQISSLGYFHISPGGRPEFEWKLLSILFSILILLCESKSQAKRPRNWTFTGKRFLNQGLLQESVKIVDNNHGLLLFLVFCLSTHCQALFLFGLWKTVTSRLPGMKGQFETTIEHQCIPFLYRWGKANLPLSTTQIKP